MAAPRDSEDAATPAPRAGAGPRPLPPHLDPRGPRGARAGRPAPGPGSAARTGPRGVPLPPPRRRTARILSWIAVLTSLALLATAVGGYALVTHYDGNISRIDVFGNRNRPAATPRGAQNILIVGSDSRGDLKAGEGFQGRGAGFVTGQRSDTVILAHLYGSREKAQLISFPRDSWVPIPEHVSLESGKVVPERTTKLNTAFAEGGAPLLIDTIEKLTDLRIDRYLQIDFDGFQAMVNTLGGVEVCLSKPAKEPLSGIDLPAGRQTIQGGQALAFVRQRTGLPRGDIDRIERQQQFIGSVVRKTLSAGTLLNPFKLNGVIGVATDSLQVDEDLSIGDLRDLALRFKSFDAGDVIFSTVPTSDIAARRQGQSVVLLDEPKLAMLSDTLRRDVPPGPPEAPGGAPDTEQPLTVPPSGIQVKVFNGSNVPGLGRRAYDDLAAGGFALVGEPGNRGGSGAGTLVLHGPDKADSARTLVASIAGARAQLDPALGRTLEVVVGSGYSGAKKVAVGPVGPGAREAAAPGPEVKTAAGDPCAA